LERLMRADEDMFALWPAFGPGDWISAHLDAVAKANEVGDWMTYAVLLPDGQVAGSSSFMAIEHRHKRVEVGGTCYARKHHGTKVNSAAKLLLLEAAFSAGANRVEFKVDARNARSRAAVAKLGATEEGTFRSHMVLPTGHVRDTVYYSIIAAEWPSVRAGLEARLAQGT
jgi:RimJ/RimL family protein N-acetyltransferase